MLRLLCTWIAVGVLSYGADIRVFAGKAHLRSGEAREWRSFSERSQGKVLSIPFEAPAANEREYSLILRQRDVKHRTWAVRVNGTEAGRLLDDERRMICVLPVAAGVLRAGSNVLEVAAGAGTVSDDIEVSNVEIRDTPVASLLREGSVAVAVRPAMPARITVVDADGWLAPLVSLRDGDAVRTGVVYTGDGQARIGLPAGDYRVYASRGFDYSAADARVRLAQGGSRTLELGLTREVSLPGFVSVDTHVHTLELSGHGDASVEERVVTAAGEGLDVVVATEHNRLSDYSVAIEQKGLSRWVRSIGGNEVTTPMGHFNVFPTAGQVADWKQTDWPALRALLRNTVVIQNHPRDVHSKYRPFDPGHHLSIIGENLRGRPVFANAMEVVNSGAMASDPLQLVRDWMGLLTRGLQVAGIGASDTHTVDFVPIGQARTYVEGSDVAQGIASGKTLVSYGLAATLRQMMPIRNGRAKLEVSVLAPSWSGADTITIFSNGFPVWQHSMKRTARFKRIVDIALPKHDAALVAVATGPGVMQPFWEVRKPYQPTSLDWNPIVLGVSAAVWVDGDNDGKRTSPMAYAEVALRDGSDFAAYDDSVVAHAAHFLHVRGTSSTNAEIRKKLESRNGYRQYLLQKELAER